jgi:hypothetical protein
MGAVTKWSAPVATKIKRQSPQPETVTDTDLFNLKE